jgi:hypothetical protein
MRGVLENHSLRVDALICPKPDEITIYRQLSVISQSRTGHYVTDWAIRHSPWARTQSCTPTCAKNAKTNNQNMVLLFAAVGNCFSILRRTSRIELCALLPLRRIRQQWGIYKADEKSKNKEGVTSVILKDCERNHGPETFQYNRCVHAFWIKCNGNIRSPGKRVRNQNRSPGNDTGHTPSQ